MSASDLALSIKGLSKAYTIAHGGLKRPTFREAVIDRLRNPLKKSNYETFWALKEISFDVNKGDVVGIIGRNGAGKSTLLKILSRITEPTAGEIDVYGRIGSLLEVGTGFHPELTGRENIYLNGAILGMHRPEIRKHFDEIVDFAGVEKFLDTPVKRYSSGMYIRLAFAVAAHLNSDILIIDEVLAVGDVEFQKKCLGKMKDVGSSGRTVLFVSHNTDAIISLCRKAVLLNKGEVQLTGDAEAVIREYLVRDAATNLLNMPRAILTLKQPILSDIAVFGDDNQVTHVGGPLKIDVTVNSPEVLQMECGIVITNQRGQRVGSLHSRWNSQMDFHFSGSSVLTCEIPELMLVPARYFLDITLTTGYGQTLEKVEQAAFFDVVFKDVLRTGLLPQESHGAMVIAASWNISQAEKVLEC